MTGVILSVFGAANPFVNFLLKSYCLSLYGCALRSLSSSSIKILEVGFSKLLRKLWCLPRTLLCTVLLRFTQYQPSYLIVLIFFHLSFYLLHPLWFGLFFSASSQCVYSFISYIYGFKHLITYSFSDLYISDIVHRIKYLYGCHLHCEGFISYNL